MPENDVTDYHAHVYFAPETRRNAMELRDMVLSNSFFTKVGEVYDRRAEPHPLPMYQITFSPEDFGSIVPFLSFNRRGLSILVHPNTGDLIPDHTERTIWMGEVLNLDLEYLNRFVEEKEG